MKKTLALVILTALLLLTACNGDVDRNLWNSESGRTITFSVDAPEQIVVIGSQGSVMPVSYDTNATTWGEFVAEEQKLILRYGDYMTAFVFVVTYGDAIGISDHYSTIAEIRVGTTPVLRTDPIDFSGSTTYYIYFYMVA